MPGQRGVLLGVSEVANELRLNADAVYRLIRTGELQAIRIASKEGVEPRKMRVPYSSVVDYVERLLAEQLGLDPRAAAFRTARQLPADDTAAVGNERSNG